MSLPYRNDMREYFLKNPQNLAPKSGQHIVNIAIAASALVRLSPASALHFPSLDQLSVRLSAEGFTSILICCTLKSA